MKFDDALVYFETDGECANCGFKDARALTIHHIESADPRSELYDNKIVLCHNCHQCHHQGKGPSGDDIKAIKSRLIVKILTRPGLNALKIAVRKGGVVASPISVQHLVEMRYLRHACDLSTTSVGEGEGQEVAIDAIYEATSEGAALLSKWKL